MGDAPCKPQCCLRLHPAHDCAVPYWRQHWVPCCLRQPRARRGVLLAQAQWAAGAQDTCALAGFGGGEIGFLSWWLLACGQRGCDVEPVVRWYHLHDLCCSPVMQGCNLPLKHCFEGQILSFEEAGFYFLGEQKPPVQLRCSQVLNPQPAPHPSAPIFKWGFCCLFGVHTGGEKEQVDMLWFRKQVTESELVLWAYSSSVSSFPVARGKPGMRGAHRVPAPMLLPPRP